MYDGQKVSWYKGTYGSEADSKLLESYKGTSGAWGYQKSTLQKVKNAGPIPEGDYTLNLEPDPDRVAKQLPDGQLTRSSEGGIEKIPTTFRGNTVRYSSWGTIRARLDAVKSTNTYGRHSFYIHNSNKGYSSGCIECESGFFTRLLNFRKNNPKIKKLRVKVKYKHYQTNGGTQK